MAVLGLNDRYKIITENMNIYSFMYVQLYFSLDECSPEEIVAWRKNRCELSMQNCEKHLNVNHHMI